ncbi:MAG: GGDEF domain-containing protein [Bacillota bacterium]
MPTLHLIITLIKAAVVAGWLHIVLLLVRSLRPTNRTIYSFRLLAALLGAGAALQTALMLVRGAAMDGLLPGALAGWPGWIWLEAPVTLLIAVCTVLLVQLMMGRRYLVINDALREIRRLRSEVGIDRVTGLYNRTTLEQRLAELAGGPEALSIIFIDVDHFKRYNDSFGHPAGDEVLRRMGGLLARSVRRSDVVARYGGEEFVILLPGAGKLNGMSIAEQIRRRVAEEEFPHRHVTISVGVASAPVDGRDLNQLLQLADQAMYRAKADGGNRVYDAGRLPGRAGPSTQEGESQG